MKLLVIIVSLCTILCPFDGFSQNLSQASIRWNSDQGIEMVQGVRIQSSTVLKTIAPTSAEWRDASGGILGQYEILEVRGVWTNANNIGRIQFEIKDTTTGNTGSLVIVREAGGLKATLAIADVEPRLVELSIQNFEIL